MKRSMMIGKLVGLERMVAMRRSGWWVWVLALFLAGMVGCGGGEPEPFKKTDTPFKRLKRPNPDEGPDKGGKPIR